MLTLLNTLHKFKHNNILLANSLLYNYLIWGGGAVVFTLRAPSETDWIVLGWAWQTWIWRETRPGNAAQMARADPWVTIWFEWLCCCCWSICCWRSERPAVNVTSPAFGAWSDRVDGGFGWNGGGGGGNVNDGEVPDNPKCLWNLKKIENWKLELNQIVSSLSLSFVITITRGGDDFPQVPPPRHCQIVLFFRSKEKQQQSRFDLIVRNQEKNKQIRCA